MTTALSLSRIVTSLLVAGAVILATMALTAHAQADIDPPQASADATYNTMIDFSVPITQLDAHSFGGTVSGYGVPWLVGPNGQCGNAQCEAMRQLNLGAYRVSIQWNGGNPVSGAGGNGAGGMPGDQMVDAIRAAGAEPIVVIGGKGGQNDMDFTVSDAANLVVHYSSGAYAGAAAVKQYVIGNEPANPGNGAMTMGQYCARFNAVAEAMRQANADIKLIGPAWPYYDLETLKQFLRCAGDKVDVIDYHAYGRSDMDIDQNIRSSAQLYEQQNKAVRAAINEIVPQRAQQIAIQVGEYNVSPFATDDSSDPRFYAAGTTVWNALATGSIVKGGGRALVFADQNNPLGLMFQEPAIAGLYSRQAGDTQPAYHGIGMFTGEGLFRGFGSTMVQTQTSNPEIVVYASSNPKNIVLVNKHRDQPQLARLRFNGYSGGTATIWQTDPAKPFDRPAKIGSMPIEDSLAYGLPPYSVTTILLD